jgi:ketosteroid isomerase-like protein
MDYRAGIFLMVFGGLLLTTSSCSAGDLEDVKAVWDQQVKAYNAMNVDALYTNIHKEVVGFGPIAPFAYESSAFAKQGLAEFFASLESINVTPINWQFRVFGNTAVGWGHYATAIKPKDGPFQVLFGRYTVTYAKLGDKWVSVSDHNSSMPSGN